jgi:DNA polymerase III alpha subunit
MKLDEYGNCIFQDYDLFDMLYENKSEFSNIKIEDSFEIKTFIEETGIALDRYIAPTMSISEFDKQNQNNWFVPEEYLSFDIYDFCTNNCENDDQLIRCFEELVLFEKLNMIPLFGVLKYIVDSLRKNKVLWGVGRGSSVASYVLYKLGVHRIDSMKYNLDYREFLRLGEEDNGSKAI